MCGILVYTGNSETLKDFDKQIAKIIHRGPDNLNIHNNHKGVIAFHRLRIMDLSGSGDQPFIDLSNNNMVVCNGELYNYKQLKAMVDYRFASDSDCEVLLPLYRKFGLLETARLLDAEFAFVLWDASKRKFVAARDPLGIRPLFYGYSNHEAKIIFASEAKAITPYCDRIMPFPPGHVYDGDKFIPYIKITEVSQYHEQNTDEILNNIHDKLIEAVRKRLSADAPVGYLLSGGLDSSLVCAIAGFFSHQPLRTFSVGMDDDAIDLKYARQVADFIKADHTEVIITRDDVWQALEDVIYHLESYDITTIRASIGMYLLCKHIHEKTDIKVILTGEVSDELFGYKYTDFAPSPDEFQMEAKKRIDEIYMYDVLRADRCISAHALEARVPFSDKEFVQYVMSLNPKMKMNTTGIGKYLLRKAFDNGLYLPDSILWREKAAFSDAVGHSLADSIREKAEQIYKDKDLTEAQSKYSHVTPISKESLLYRDLFEKHFSGYSHLIKDFWLPNQNWANCRVNDPSARVLPNYGASGM